MTAAAPTDPAPDPSREPAEAVREDLTPWFRPLFELPDPQERGPLDWASIFPNPGPIELDVGSGRGRFTNEGAAARPGVNLCGIEHDFTAARRGAKRLKRDASPNARVIGGDAVRFLRAFVPAGSLAAVHVLYPDPWWKRRHRKRRLLGETVGGDFLELILKALAPNGRIHVRTDVGEYFEGITALLDAHPRLCRRADPLDETAAAIQAATSSHAGADPLTNYERKAVVGPDRPDFRTDATVHKAVWNVIEGDGETADGGTSPGE
ncbi:tRNA (guanine(46)-N(7))-methyltransferase TrmB [Alienimonas chondri]|uniref:tRNA (guanine(46)-N(7))-methyltransferase n=1 Tax=Alienimonas chondri TaxID=2681879 RepID=A0ABX1V9K7_9PLAN|nr:tRNA (guanine-N7)-methyltransferase [Alienimonas chondri]NNJ24200.1 tRNA (guanine-N(7)-)-methyltransferase [Alienimonas chondri]